MNAIVLSSITYELFDSGIANILGLETLNHGTNPLNHLRIRMTGADPTHGHKSSGSTQGWHTDNTTNYFYVFKDSQYALKPDPHAPLLYQMLIEPILCTQGIGNRILPALHTILSGYNFTAHYFQGIRYSTRISYISGICSFLFSPRLRFRFTQIDLKRFENDPKYWGAAYRTKYPIEPWRIGLLGSLLVGINLDWFSRVKAHPLKILTGTVQLTCSIAITFFSLSTFAAQPGLVIAGALLA